MTVMKRPQKHGVQIDIVLALQGSNAMQDSGCILRRGGVQIQLSSTKP